jgi:hypothetical protein
VAAPTETTDFDREKYGATSRFNTEQLAAFEPDLAVQNADSYQYQAEYNMGD